MSTKIAPRSRQERNARALRDAHRRRLSAIVWAAGLVVVIGIVAFMMLTSTPQSSSQARTAPDFTLTDTAGSTVSLHDYLGKNVVLYFSEGAGCQSCLVQMGQIEKSAAAFAQLDITVLPIVMNTREQIMQDMAANGVQTPFLLDDGTVSNAYGTIGSGMHAGLPGHSFVLIDKQGQQRWYGAYPSMFLAPNDLLAEIRTQLDL